MNSLSFSYSTISWVTTRFGSNCSFRLSSINHTLSPFCERCRLPTTSSMTRETLWMQLPNSSK